MTPASAATSSTDPGGRTTATLGSALRSGFQRWQFWLLLLAAGLLAVVLVQALSQEDLDPYGLENTDLDGYAALAQVLTDHDVRIHEVASSQVAQTRMDDHPEAPLVVLSTGEAPDEEFLEPLREDPERPVVWISESPSLVNALYPEGPTSFAGTSGDGGPGRPAAVSAGEDCPVPAAVAAESLEAPGAVFAGDLPGCFSASANSGESGQLLVDSPAGLIFGAPQAFTNQDITAAGHAALALWLFGQDDDLIWYTPMGLDTLGSQDWASPTDFLADWVVPLAWWLLLCAVVLMLVLGRRAGPVVTEPLPVHVPAAETAEGRGRMYQSANAVDASAQTLRSAHLVRMAHLLRLGASPAATAVIHAAARQTRRNPQELAALVDRRPGSNAELVAYAQALATVEDEARRGLLSEHPQTPQPPHTSPNTQGKNTGND